MQRVARYPPYVKECIQDQERIVNMHANSVKDDGALRQARTEDTLKSPSECLQCDECHANRHGESSRKGLAEEAARGHGNHLAVFHEGRRDGLICVARREDDGVVALLSWMIYPLSSLETRCLFRCRK
ncbi:hypothetical protein TraAM80_00937, partial [Trypanosoma rangeli]